jgi:hypothetical protein
MALHAMQFSQSLYQIQIFVRKQFSDNFLIHLKQKAWSCECLDAIICDTECEDKMYTMQIEIKEYWI